jgi:hypothetical protein
MKKVGLFCLALVLAIGALGVGYAAWTDTIFINGTVNTGSVDINAEYFSGTEIYKNISTGDEVIRFWIVDETEQLMYQNMPVPSPLGSDPGEFFLVASAGAAPGGADDKVDITFTNAFPSMLLADVIVHNTGSVPVIVDVGIIQGDLMLEWLWDNGYAYGFAQQVSFSSPPSPGGSNWDIQFGPVINEPIQMEQCQYAKLWIFLDLPQDGDLDENDLHPVTRERLTQADFMDKDWSFMAHIFAIQWNEYQPEWWLP